MIFSELYSVYYTAASRILQRVLAGSYSEGELREIVRKYAFEESAGIILPALENGRWQLFRPDGTTTLRHSPSMPLTALEKSWLRAIASDRRLRLFGISPEDFPEADPLFTEADYFVYDRYSDGDPYEDADYIRRFRIILEALREKLPLRIVMTNRTGNPLRIDGMPQKLEYSEKDDKFRLIIRGNRFVRTINLARITDCRRISPSAVYFFGSEDEKQRTLILEIHDERSAMERVMLHFAHFEKQAEHIGKNTYRLRILFDESDETEMVIRVLSFGPLVRVIGDELFVGLIRERLKKQKSCGLR